jgi:hypothetical protein
VASRRRDSISEITIIGRVEQSFDGPSEHRDRSYRSRRRTRRIPPQMSRAWRPRAQGSTL